MIIIATGICVRYGTGPMLREAQARFASTLRKFKDSNAYCYMFGRLWGLFDALDEPWCDFYLYLAGFIFRSTVSHPTEDIALPTKSNLAHVVR